MVNQVREVCNLGDHFWYPRLKELIEHISGNITQSPLIKLDLGSLYTKRPDTLRATVIALSQKFFHEIKIFFSRSYRISFARSVELIANAERRQNAASIIQRVYRRHLFKENIKGLIEERKNRARAAQERLERAVTTCRKYMQKRQAQRVNRDRIQLPYNILRDKIRQLTCSINEHNSAEQLLIACLNAHKTIKELEKNKPTGLLSYFIGETAQTKELREKKLFEIETLNGQINKSLLMSDPFKKSIEAYKENPKQVRQQIKEEIQNQKKTIEDCKQQINQAKATFYALIPA